MSLSCTALNYFRGLRSVMARLESTDAGLYGYTRAAFGLGQPASPRCIENNDRRQIREGGNE